MDDVRSNLGFDSFMERSIGIDNVATPLVTVGNTGALAVTGSSVSTSLAALSNATQAQPLQGAGDSPVASQSTIPDGSYSFDQLTINKLFANQDMQSSNFVSGSVGWQIKGNGDVEFNNGTFRGTVSAGTFVGGSIHIPDQNTTANSFHTNSTGNSWWGCTQTNFNTNNDNATAYILSTGIAKFQHVTLSGGSNVIFISDTLDTSSKKILKDFNFGTTNYAGAVNAGNVTWNTTTGAITGGSGVIVYRLGIIGVNAGSTTFSIDSTTGAATFAGTLSAPSGNIGGFTIGASTLSATSGGNTTTLSSGSTAFSAGPTGSPTITITQAGVLTATGAVIAGYLVSSKGSFGGDGSDGALSISSGTTTIDCANAAVVIKNYTSISITGTAKLAFSNPNTNGTIVVLKSQGNTVITSSTVPCVDMSNMGGANGALAVNPNDGSDGSVANDILGGNASQGIKGLHNNNAVPANGGVAYTSTMFYLLTLSRLYRKFLAITCGSGGGSGGTGLFSSGAPGNSGVGGKGGGGLIIQCGGALNFSGNISVAGQNGGDAAASVAVSTGSGGGGGGAGGMCVILYNTLTANSGTITISGGAGGAGYPVTSGGSIGNGGQGGGGGGMYNGAGGAGGRGGLFGGSAATAGSSGSSSFTTSADAGSGGTGSGNSGGGGGGGGTAGEYLIVQNTVFA